VDEAAAQIAAAKDAAVQTGQNAINRAGEVAYDAKQSFDEFTNSYVPKPKVVDSWKDRGYPSYMTGDNPDVWGAAAAQSQLGKFNPKTLPKTINDIPAYRADPTGKYGGKDGLETQPTKFVSVGQGSPYGGGNAIELYSFARALAHSKKYGIPQLDATQLAAMALKEGRSDYGHLVMDFDKPQDYKLYEKMKADGLDSRAAAFAVNVKQKMEVAKRLGISFEEAWNGTGRNFLGQSGKDYKKNFEVQRKAVQHPKNKQLVGFIQSALDAEK
jgi:hypothetical protein